MKIGFTGTMSVGKTTLVNALKNNPKFKDYTFRTERSKYLRDLGIPLNTDSTLKGQSIFLAERCSELLQENIITDRTVIDVMAFTNLSTSIPFYEGDDFEKLASRFVNDYDYIFYIPPTGIEIEDNGVRTTDEKYRGDINFEIKRLLIKYRHPSTQLIELSGTTDERVDKINHFIFS